MSNDQAQSETGSPDLTSLGSQLSELEGSLAELTAGHRKGLKVATVIGIAIPLVILAYFTFIFSQIRSLTDPESLVSMAEDMIRQNVPAAVEATQDFAKQTIPALTQQYLDQGEGQMRGLREQGEKALLDYTKGALQDSTGNAMAQVKEMIRKNKPEMQETLDTLSSDEGAALFRTDLKDGFDILLEKEFGKKELASEVASWERLVADVSKKLEQLKSIPEAQLTDEQRLEVKLIVMCKALLIDM